MPRPELPKKPLVEAIFELRWKLKEVKQGDANLQVDPNYKLLPGRVFERVIGRYPHHQPLEQSSIPDEMTPYIVHHRFRAGPDEWPLVQLGPGVMTVNDTSGYKWETFMPLCLDLQDTLVHTYPENDALRLSTLMLRYIDAIVIEEGDPKDQIAFLEGLLNTRIRLPGKLFDGNVNAEPRSINTVFTYEIAKPKGIMSLKLSSGRRDDKTSIIMETSVSTSGDEQLAQCLASPEFTQQWLDEAHEISSHWFRSLVDGELYRRYEDNA